MKINADSGDHFPEFCANLIVHIGLHKTATKFMQHKIFARLGTVDPTMVYNPPDLLASLNGQYSKMAKGRRPTETEVSELRGLLARHVETARQQNKTLLISNESISQSIAFQNYADHFELFKAVFPRCRVMVTLRYQPEWIESMYRHMVASGVSIKLDEIVGSGETGNYLFNLDKINYADLVGRYLEYCGRENLKVFFYEKLFRNAAEFEGQIKIFIGCQALPAVDYSVRANSSLSAMSVIMLSYLGRLAGSRFDRSVFLASQSVGHRISHRAFRLLDNAIFWYLSDRSILRWAGLRPSLDLYFSQQNEHLAELLGEGLVPNEYFCAETEPAKSKDPIRT